MRDVKILVLVLVLTLTQVAYCVKADCIPSGGKCNTNNSNECCNGPCEPALGGNGNQGTCVEILGNGNGSNGGDNCGNDPDNCGGNEGELAGYSQHQSPDLAYFVQPLPIPPVAEPIQQEDSKLEPLYHLSMDLIQHSFHPDLRPTTMYGFNGIHPGPTIDAQTDEPINVNWFSNLPKKHPLWYAIDPTLDGMAGVPDVRNTIHLHGAHVLNTSDGLPDSWIVPGKTLHYRYPNRQEPTTLWYHDHARGITRLNVYTGLVGFYLIRTPGLDDEVLGLPTGEFEIPIVLQDKYFNSDGSLFYPTTGHGQHPIWVSDFEADTPVVNGVVAPFLVVEPRKYRFRILNGCTYRVLNILFAEDNLNFTQIGSDGGFLPKPVVIPEIRLGVSERVDVIVDFAGFSGRSIVLRNNEPPDHQESNPLPQLMRFDVLNDVKSNDETTIPPHLPGVILDDCIQKNRTLTLGEPNETYLLNNVSFNAPLDIQPVVNTTEIWRIINLTIEKHPVHIHLMEGKLLKRCDFNTTAWLINGGKDDIEPYILGACGDHQGVLPSETGLKDTFLHNPGQVTIMKVPFFTFEGTYVTHCHKLEHEDNDMMRPLEVVDGEDGDWDCIDHVQD